MLEYNYELHSFELKDQGIVVSFPFTDQDYLGSPMTIGQEAFIFDLVYKEGIPESDIKRIKIKSDEDVDNAVGWLLPLACLVSVEHPYAADRKICRCRSKRVQAMAQSGIHQITALRVLEDHHDHLRGHVYPGTHGGLQ